MVISGEKTVASFVVENMRTPEVFTKYGIDFYCKGNSTIKEICESLNIPYIVLQKELSEVETVKDVFEDYNKWSLNFLVIYIENTHHSYIKQNLPYVLELPRKKSNSLKGLKLHKMYLEINEMILKYLRKEEMILFPHIKKLTAILNGNSAYEFSPDVEIISLIKPLKDQRDQIVRLLREIIVFSRECFAMDNSDDCEERYLKLTPITNTRTRFIYCLFLSVQKLKRLHRPTLAKSQK